VSCRAGGGRDSITLLCTDVIILNYTSHPVEGRQNYVLSMKEHAAHFEEQFFTLP
jgi:hypothetical protein